MHNPSFCSVSNIDMFSTLRILLLRLLELLDEESSGFNPHIFLRNLTFLLSHSPKRLCSSSCSSIVIFSSASRSVKFRLHSGFMVAKEMLRLLSHIVSLTCSTLERLEELHIIQGQRIRCLNKEKLRTHFSTLNFPARTGIWSLRNCQPVRWASENFVLEDHVGSLWGFHLVNVSTRFKLVHKSFLCGQMFDFLSPYSSKNHSLTFWQIKLT